MSVNESFQTEDAQALLRGQPNSPVTMILQRGGKGGAPLVVTLLRAVPGGAAEPSTAPAPPVAARTFVPTRAAEPPLPPAAEPVWEPPAAVSTAQPGAMDEALGKEFKKISFLWAGKDQDPVVAALVDWKDDLLCKCLFLLWNVVAFLRVACY